MPLGLHQQCKTRLVEVLLEHFPKVLVNKRMFLDGPSSIFLYLADTVIPQSGEVKEKLEEYIGESPVYDFVYETLAQELYENQTYDADSDKLSLAEFDKYSDLERTATHFVDEIDSLPWPYIFTLEFHRELSDALLPLVNDFNLGDGVRIVQIDDEFNSTYPLVSGIDARDQSIVGGRLLSLALAKDNKWKTDSVCIQFEQPGFVGYYGDTSTSEFVKNKFKAFCGLGIALRLFKVETKYKATAQQGKFYIHRKIEEEWIVQNKSQLDRTTSDAFHDLMLHDLNGKLDTDEKRSGWARGVMNDIRSVFENSTSTKRLLLACQWLFDSYGGRNELLSFIQTTTVIEILLGDKASSDQMGLGVLLRNRCAYLIGTTQSQRNEILKDFQAIYDVRSKIVHGGKSKLNFNERRLFHKLQWMCRRVIQEEVDLFKKDLQVNA